MEKISLKICQREYSFKTDEKPEKIEKLASQLEKTIAQVSRKLLGKSEAEIVTFASVIMLSDLENIISNSDKIKELQVKLSEANIALATANEQLARMSGNGDFDDMAAEIDLLHEELEKANKRIAQLTEEVMSARMEVDHFATVKADETTKLSAKIAAYEKQFEELDEKREQEILKLRESYESANAEMEQLAQEKEAENARLHTTLCNYETTFDMYIKKKEDEIKDLQKEMERFKLKDCEKNADCGDSRPIV